MIVYEVSAGQYSPYKNAPKLYLNITNACNNNCAFCLRKLKTQGLWLESDPTFAEIVAELDSVDFAPVEEVIVCGYGEPTCRQNVLVEVLRYVKKKYQVSTRLNTNGLGNLENGRDISGEFKNLLDVVSISLNASDAENYYRITRSKFGLSAFEGMLDFAEKMKSVCKVVMTVVDKVTPEEEIVRCREICRERDFNFRLRAYENV